MQQVPKRDQDLAPLFRMLFLPEEGHQWLAADYNQQEYRIFAEYLNNQRLIDGYLADPPVDIHSNVAEMLGVERDPTAKRMNFGLINGMGPVKLAGHLGISIAQAKGFWAAYDQNLPEARQFLRAAESYAQERGWVRTKLYRRRRFPDRRFAHKAGNSIIQGTAADCTKSKMVEVDEYLASEKAESKLLLSVHDELDLSVAPDEEKVVKRCVEIMEAFGPEDLIQFKVPMRVDAKESSDWGRASFPKFEKWPKGV
jgi:DNA polymerase-1